MHHEVETMVNLNVSFTVKLFSPLSRLQTTLWGGYPAGKLGKIGNLTLGREKSENLGKVGEIVVCLWCAVAVVIHKINITYCSVKLACTR